MLARSVEELPRAGYLYEPKWDGYRCISFLEGRWSSFRSRNNKSLDGSIDDRIREELERLPVDSIVLDGELIALRSDGNLDFPSVASLRRGPGRPTPAVPVLVLFDLLFLDGMDLTGEELRMRKGHLSEITTDIRLPVFVSPATRNLDKAEGWLERSFGRGIDGIVAKPLDGRYRQGVRGWSKFRRSETAECVVAGIREERGDVVSLLLGLYDPDGNLRYAGAAAGFSDRARHRLSQELADLKMTSGAGHPWADGEERATVEEGGRHWIPVEPCRVCEVEFGLTQGIRFRHPPKFLRWRPDREPESCSTAQLSFQEV